MELEETLHLACPHKVKMAEAQGDKVAEIPSVLQTVLITLLILPPNKRNSTGNLQFFFPSDKRNSTGNLYFVDSTSQEHPALAALTNSLKANGRIGSHPAFR